MSFLGRAFVVLVIATATLTVASPAAGAATAAQVKAKALSLSNLPEGWSIDSGAQGVGGPIYLGGCLSGLSGLGMAAKGMLHVRVHYADQQLPALSETLESGKAAAERYDQFLAVLNQCRSVDFAVGGFRTRGKLRRQALPNIGNASHAFALTINGDPGASYLVLFRVAHYDGLLEYLDHSFNPGLLQAFTTEAIDKVAGKPVPPPA